MDNYCTTCARSFSRPEDFQRHCSTVAHHRKRTTSESTPIVVKKIKLQQPQPSNEYNIRLIHRGLAGFFKIYRMQLKRVFKDISFLTVLLLSQIVYLLNRAVSDTNGVKAQLRCRVTFVQDLDDTDEKTVSLNSNQRICLHSSNAETEYASAMTEISKKIEEYTQNGSGWVVKSINYIDLYISKYTPIRGTSYTRLPDTLANKKAIINIKNQDEKCFMWSVLAALHPVDRDAKRISKYKEFANELTFKGLTLPIPIDQVQKFEDLNDLVINVFGFGEGLYPLYTTKKRSKRPINLILLTPPDAPAHYCWIKNLDKLLFRETKHEGRKFVCPYCLCGFNSNTRLSKHLEFCTTDRQRLEMPEDPILKFRNIHRQARKPYVMYADFECFVKPIDDGGKKIQEHVPNSYCLLGVDQCCGKESYDEPQLYRGEAPVRHFLENVIKKGEKFIGRNPKPLHTSQSEETSFQTSTKCDICTSLLVGSDRVRDHCHQCGKFRGAAHGDCNTKLYERRDVTVFFHNLRRYDGHLIMQEIGSIANEKGFSLEVVPKGAEDYISFTINLKTNGKRWKLRFVDSLAFLNAPLDTLVSSLPSDQFPALTKFTKYPDLLKRKGSYPYDFMDCAEKFALADLPDASAFYNKLKLEPVSPENYDHAKTIWDTFELRNMGQYHDLYLVTDVLLLADVFQNFRGFSMRSFGLDPAHCITLPSFAWDALLKYTGARLELLEDPDMYHFFSAGIQGRGSVISHRHAEAHHPGVPGYNRNIKLDGTDFPHAFILYLDANNLYGWAMKQALPVGGFKWVGPLKQLPLPESGVGYTWEVDLEYPKDLHNLHNDYPLAPERMMICELSPYCQHLKHCLHLPDIATEKLVPNLHNKYRYILHHKNLDLYLKHGLVLKKIHRGIKFREENWMAPYIDFNTNMRKLASSKLVTDPAKYEKLVASPLYKESQPFKNDLTAVMMKKEKAVLSKPIYTGFSVLDLSKTLMYKFHYEYMLNNPDLNCKLLFTDTDSLCYRIYADNIYSTLEKDLDLWFDTSDYPESHPLHRDNNKKVIGMMTDETCGTPILEFVGLRAKMYSMRIAGGEEHIRAKGINRAVVKHQIAHNDYKTTLFHRTFMRHEMVGFRNHGHEIYTERLNKTSLSAYDDKRFILPDGITTLAYGHRRIEEENLMTPTDLRPYSTSAPVNVETT